MQQANAHRETLGLPVPPFLAVLARALSRSERERGGIATALGRAIDAARAQTAALADLRRSYTLVAVTLLMPLVALAVFLFAAIPARQATALVSAQALFAAAVLPFVRFELGLVRAEDGRPFHRFGLANAMTLLRLLYAPSMAGLLLLAASHPAVRLPAILLFAVAAVSDISDGAVARALRQRSAFGRIYDPVGDMLFHPGAALALSLVGAVPWWLTGILIYRYWFALLGGVFIFVKRGPYEVAPTWIGKASGFLLGWVVGAAAVDLCYDPAWLSEPLLLGLFGLSAALSGTNAVYLTWRGVALYVATRPR